MHNENSYIFINIKSVLTSIRFITFYKKENYDPRVLFKLNIFLLLTWYIRKDIFLLIYKCRIQDINIYLKETEQYNASGLTCLHGIPIYLSMFIWSNSYRVLEIQVVSFLEVLPFAFIKGLIQTPIVQRVKICKKKYYIKRRKIQFSAL